MIILISIFSLVISGLSFLFAIYAWRQVNRPLITARITTSASGNLGTTLNILLENTGNRPAKEIFFIVDKTVVENASLIGIVPPDAERCFYSDISISILANGRSIKNAFWHLGYEDSWKANAKIPILIVYSDLNERIYKEKMNLFLADDEGFAQTSWGKS